MTPTQIYYNNSLIYLAVVENNLSLTETLLSKGFPKSPASLPKKDKRKLSVDDYNKISISYSNAFSAILKHLIEDPKKNRLLRLFLQSLLEQGNVKHQKFFYRNYIGNCFLHNNFEAFEIFADIFGKEHITDNHSLQWYSYQVMKGTFSKEKKKALLKSLEDYGIDWGDAPYCFERCVNIQLKEEEFDYFYKKRKQALSNNPHKTKIIRRELMSSIERVLFHNIEVDRNITNPILSHIIKKPELNIKNGHEGVFWLLKKALKICLHTNQSIHFLELYLSDLNNKEPQIISYLNKKTQRNQIMEISNFIEKLNLHNYLNKHLTKELNTCSKPQKI